MDCLVNPKILAQKTSTSPCLNVDGARATPVRVDLLVSWYFNILGSGLTTLTSWPQDLNNSTLSLTNVPLATLVGSGYIKETTRMRTMTPKPNHTSSAVCRISRFSFTEPWLLNRPEPTTQLVTPHSPTIAIL